MHRSARRHRVWDSSTACLLARWTLTYPLKPSYAGVPGHIPLREIDGWTCITTEISYRLP